MLTPLYQMGSRREIPVNMSGALFSPSLPSLHSCLSDLLGALVDAGGVFTDYPPLSIGTKRDRNGLDHTDQHDRLKRNKPTDFSHRHEAPSLDDLVNGFGPSVFTAGPNGFELLGQPAQPPPLEKELPLYSSDLSNPFFQDFGVPLQTDPNLTLEQQLYQLGPEIQDPASTIGSTDPEFDFESVQGTLEGRYGQPVEHSLFTELPVGRAG